MRIQLSLIQIALYLTSLLVSSSAISQQHIIKTLDGRELPAIILHDSIQHIIDDLSIPGLSIAIINDKNVVYHDVFGVANAITQTQVTQKSIFEGASLSKPIFAYFVMQQAEAGIIDLDKPLHEYLPHPGIAPQSQEDYKLITARMVLSHQTGFPNHSHGEPIHLEFKPGTGFSYSGEAYQYLAAIVGELNGVSIRSGLNGLFRKSVTLPIGMEHTTFLWDDYLKKHKVYGHDKSGKPTQNAPGEMGWSGETFNAFSSIHSEAQEYALFIKAMLDRKGLTDASFDEMLREHRPFDKDNPLRQEIGQTGWGLGFAQKKTPEGTMHMHTGNNHDFQAYAMFIPAKNYGLVVFINCDKMPLFLGALSKILGPQF